MNIYKLGYMFARSLRGGNYGSKLRIYLLRKMGADIGTDVYIAPDITITNPKCLFIGNHVSIQEGCYIDTSAPLTIGNDVSIAHHVSILTFNHAFTNPSMPIRNQGIELTPIIICSDVWIGCKAVLLPGTSIGRRTVVGAMTLCNKTYNGHEVLVGSPARSIKKI